MTTTYWPPPSFRDQPTVLVCPQCGDKRIDLRYHAAWHTTQSAVQAERTALGPIKLAL